ncbi:MAG: bifunctional diaminohydroxyphosphoribosylaminopyrimidine deaminase/5-amino-6-(5-phosphoribosylamino)uracil reductase RibD [Schwartzia sp.]|nr:bifunctional diaminohydroxyphosphoribosylaminopyrimidine deaminase/5-amino-6-(5-phosphoribosylamino)uracil reductase RibD [Schwartzia sp. (in: firmicutes)]
MPRRIFLRGFCFCEVKFLDEERYMREALRLALNGRGRTSPNPMVGAVLVKGGRIVGAGWHRKAGTEHAEVHALRMAGDLARGATLYVTLEPCSHTGRTGPCAKALIEAGVRRVVAAMEDPNPLVHGKGFQMLREGDVEVSCGLLEEEARRLNEAFVVWVTEKRPFVTLKMAMTLDGKTATAGGESKWITGEAARLRGHVLRDENDAILVGIRTVLADRPSLTTRLPEGNGKNPLRVILDSKARTPLDTPMLKDGAAPVLIATTESAPEENLRRLREAGAEILTAGKGASVDLPILLRKLRERNICSLLVEGGSTVHFSFLSAGLADKVYAFIAPMLVGGRDAVPAVGGDGFSRLADAARLENICVEQMNGDFCIVGYIKR